MGARPAIVFIDQTLREGMQFRGIVFNTRQRETALRFQEALGIDVCQAGYPPAHPWEAEQVKHLADLAFEQGFNIRVAALGRALIRDIDTMAACGIRDFHLHAHIPEKAPPGLEDRVFQEIADSVRHIRDIRPGADISLAMLDVGRMPPPLLLEQVKRLSAIKGLGILSLPDTSGMIPPNRFCDLIRPLADTLQHAGIKVSVHCHNDMGMASANTIMGVAAGAVVVEASALGIGERNGLADLYTTARILCDQGFEINLKIDDMETFRDYYIFVNDIVKTQTGQDILTYNTPFFGDAVKTHVAGTHADTAFGISKDEAFYLNLLCSKGLVKKYLDAGGISYYPETLPDITRRIKTRSSEAERALTDTEIRKLVNDVSRESRQKK